MDIAEFLTARYDEDEQIARIAGGRMNGGYHWDNFTEETPGHGATIGNMLGAVVVYDCNLGRIHADHIMRHDPARVLADIAAKREILKLHKPNVEVEGAPPAYPDPHIRYQQGRVTYWCSACDHDRDFGYIAGPDEGCRTLRQLVAPYVGHPSFDRAWSVDASE